MASPFVAEIRAFPFNFAPSGWATCDGQLLSISQNTALFSLLGTNFGGDGRSTFGLPDLRSAVPIHAGASSGPGLEPVYIGQTGGEETIALLTTEMPSHTHTMQAAATPGNLTDPTGAALTRASGGSIYDAAPASPSVQMGTSTIGVTGGSIPHNNLMPYLTLTYCIALQGIFPSRP